MEEATGCSPTVPYDMDPRHQSALILGASVRLATDRSERHTARSTQPLVAMRGASANVVEYVSQRSPY